MTDLLRILHLEDDPDYSVLVHSMLEREGVRHELLLVSDRREFEQALKTGQFDLILADYLLPNYDGLAALRVARRKLPHIPFLLVSGTMGEQAAIDGLKAGATDYVLKACPERLIPAILRAAQEAQEKQQRILAEQELRRREVYFKTLTENALDIVTILNAQGDFVYNSPSLTHVLGYEKDQMVGRSVFSIVHPEDLEAVKAAFFEGLHAADRTVKLNARVRHQDGSWRFLEAVGQNRLDDPDIGGVVLNFRDVTDRRKVEENLRNNEQQYRLIFDSNKLPMWVFEAETLRFLEVNEAAVEQYGYSRDEFLSLSLADIRPDGDAPAMVEYLHKLLSSSDDAGGYSGRWCHRRKNGSLFDVELKWNKISFKGRLAFLASANDITERKRDEHRDAAFTKLGQSLSSSTTPGEAAAIIKEVADDLFRWDIFSLNLFSAETKVSTPVLNIDTDATGRRFEVEATLVPGLQRYADRVLAHGAEVIAAAEPSGDSTHKASLSSGTRRLPVSVMVAPIRNRTKLIGVLCIQSYSLPEYEAHDLSTFQTLGDHCAGALERIHAEQALRESEQRFRVLFEASPDATFVEDYEATVLDVNPAACRLHGMTREQLIGKKVTDLVPPDLAEQVLQTFRDLVDGKVSRIEGFCWTEDKRAVPVELRASRVEYSGHPAMLLHVRDTTEQKEAEAALRSSEMLFHSVWENSANGMRLTNSKGLIVAVNESFCRLVGIPRRDLEGKPLSVIYAEGTAPDKDLEEYRRKFAERITDQQVERSVTLRDGRKLTIEDTTSFVEVRGQAPLLLGWLRDVTAQKQLEEQFRQSQKMEAIGQLAGGVAHDFNNILTVIHGHASVLLAAGGLTGPCARSAQQIVEASERAGGLTRQLLTFSRRQVLQPRPLDMNEVVSHLTRMLARILGEDVALQVNYCPQPALVLADAGMMEQVLLNFAVNSRDAMPRGGSLTIKISVEEANSEPTVQHPGAKHGRLVCLTVSDTGSGIPPENLKRIFEPFFTTKEVGKGTGLGLATVYGIVDQHKGRITVDSQMNKGTTFTVLLPFVAGVVEATEKVSGEQSACGGNETIMVVEDEAAVRELVCDLLAGQGYRILEAESGAKALEVWRQCKQKVDLLLTDLVMPDLINGRELAERLWSECPELKVIFTSGYSAEAVGKDFVTGPGLNYLQKPYPPQRLAVTVRECLDARN